MVLISLRDFPIFTLHSSNFLVSGGMLAEGINARLNGTNPDYSLQDFANASQVTNLSNMARAQAAANQGNAIKVAYHSSSGTIKDMVTETYNTINERIDERPNPGGPCPPEPDPDNPPPPPPPPPPISGPAPPPQQFRGHNTNFGGMPCLRLGVNKVLS